MNYSIIIPVYNEHLNIPTLLEKLKPYSAKNFNEIIIIDDGSIDGTRDILESCQFINLLVIEKNKGKGNAIRNGINEAKFENIIIFDGDLELDPKYIKKLMLLDKENGISVIFGSRYKDKMTPKFSLWTFGNYIFTKSCNIIYDVNLKDALCCAKAFYKSDLDDVALHSDGFDIDIELKLYLLRKHKIKTVFIPYKRRTKSQGKKLNYFHSFKILSRIIRCI